MADVYTKTAGQIIEEALRKARIIAVEQPVQASDYARGLLSLNNISKHLQTRGLHLWKQGRAVLPLNRDQRVYKLGPDGAKCGREDSFFSTALTADAVLGAATLAVSSTTGMLSAPDILESSPVVSTQDWTAINNATLSVSSGLVITNVGANDGGAEYSLATTAGRTYRVRFGYTQGTSADCVFSVINSTTVEDTVTLAAAGTGELTITAIGTEIVFRAQNGSSVNGETSTVASLQYVDEESGSQIGIELPDNTRYWTYVLNVDSSTDLTISGVMPSTAVSGASVFHYQEQISRPLRLDNYTYSNKFNQSEIPVNNWSRQEYMAQPDKGSRGTVVNAYYNPDLNEGNLYVWQVAGSVTNVLRFDCREPLDIYVIHTDILDIPSEYYMAMLWNMAADLGPEYGINMERQLVLEQKANAFLEDALDNDAEESTLQFVPDFT